MIAIVTVNVVLAMLIVAAVLSLLGWGIVTDRAAWPATRPFRGWGARGRHRALRAGALRLEFGRVAPQGGRR
jgi:hypothetical protein